MAARSRSKPCPSKRRAKGGPAPEALPDPRLELPRLLAAAPRPGHFVATGAAELPVVKIVVEGVGTLGLPVQPAQARALIDVATPAPYGKGERTIVDPRVRRCWQLPAEDVRGDDPRWVAVLDRITKAAVAGLGVEGKVTAELYKLLVYDQGSFFAEHRDTEKVPGMFATLVVTLPSEHEGGELVVRHAGQEETLDLASDDVGTVRWAAFYTDCLHELRPVRSGHRLALVYNLVRRGGHAPLPPDRSEVVDAAVAALRAWPRGDASPVKLVLPLAHHYTPAELSFATLKNEDSAAAAILTAACARADVVLRLAMVSIEETGSAQEVWDGGYGRRRWRAEGDALEFEVIEVDERVSSIDGWRTPDDRPEPRGPIEVEDDELAPPGSLTDEEPDESHFHEATGNEGGSFERTYRRAALVLWPTRNERRLLLQGGPEVSVAAIERLLEAGGSQAQAVELAAAVVDSWPRPVRRDVGLPLPSDRVEHRERLLVALTRLQDRAPLLTLLRDIVAAGAFDGAETAALVDALDHLEPGDAQAVVHALVRTAAPSRLPELAHLLRALTEASSAIALAPPLDTLVATLDAPRAPSKWSWIADPEPRQISALLDLVHTISWLPRPEARRVGDRLVAALRDRQRDWPLDEVVVPAALELPRRGDVGAALRLDVVSQLRARVELELEPPRSARRSTTGIDCRCAHCQALRVFLKDEQETTWSLRAAEAARRHVQQNAREAKADLAFRTERRGSPHTLVCTKTQASYEARVKQREGDLAALAALER